MQTLFIPPLGSKLELKKDWKFPLYFERRNTKLVDYFNLPYENKEKGWGIGWRNVGEEPKEVVIPKGAILVVDRIYIRQGSSGYDSITFRWSNASNNTNKGKNKTKSVRFWAKLGDVNGMKVEILQ